MKFAIDIDSTLYDFSTPAREAFLKLYEQTGNRDYRRGAYASWVEWRSLADVCGIEAWLEVVSMCHQPEIILKQIPFPGAVETLQALHNQGYTLMYISSRDPASEIATREWLYESGFPMHEGVEVHCHMDAKLPYLLECQYLIDDRPRTLIEFVYDPNRPFERWGLSLLYEYNRALTDVPNIFLSPTWAGLNEWMVRKGILNKPAHSPLEV